MKRAVLMLLFSLMLSLMLRRAAAEERVPIAATASNIAVALPAPRVPPFLVQMMEVHAEEGEEAESTPPSSEDA